MHNARRRRRIRTGSNPTSVMKKRMHYISSMVVKTSVASITERKHIINGKLKKNNLFYMKNSYGNMSYFTVRTEELISHCGNMPIQCTGIFLQLPK